jgi:hypothetical protein
LAQRLTNEVQYCERLSWLSEEQRRDLQRIYLLGALVKLDEHNAPLAWIQGVVAMARDVGCTMVEIGVRLCATTRRELAHAAGSSGVRVRTPQDAG